LSTQVRRVARFELLRLLGSDAHATRWLAHDPRLDRDVVVKLLTAPPEMLDAAGWLLEARVVSRLMHPHILPVFEADIADGQAYLVFEHVLGTVLADACARRPPMRLREAATVLLQVLDALVAAHTLGIVHGELTARHVLLGDDGRARVTDFGQVGLGHRSGARPAPATDVSAAAQLLVEMLGGSVAAGGPGAQSTVGDVAGWPSALQADDGLRSIALRATAAALANRFDTAQGMHTALVAWLNPQAPTPEPPTGHGTLEFLLRRMRHKTDFPALSDSVVRIQRMATSDSESLGSLSGEILKDVSLTHKLLRMVNTVHFGHAGGAGVSTVSRAVALVGFAGVRNMALSVLLLEHMNDRAHAAVLLEEFMRSLMAGTLASELMPVARDSEDAFLGSMFQGLGRLLTGYYFPEEALQIREEAAREGGIDAAAHRVLGLSLEELGIGVARAWGLPQSLQRAMRTPVGDVRDRAAEAGVERLRWAGRAAHALTDALLSADGPEQQRALFDSADLYSAVLDLSKSDILAATQAARLRLAQVSQALGLHSPAGAASRRLLMGAPRPTTGVVRPPRGQENSGAALRFLESTPKPTTGVVCPPRGQEISGTALRLLESDPGSPSTVSGALAPAGLAHSRLANALLQRGLDSLRQTQASPQVLLQRLLELLHRALGLRCAVCCLREAATGHLVGRLAVGSGARKMAAAFRIEPSLVPGADLFAALCAKGADTLIADAAVAPVASRLPAWYRQAVNAPTFLLLPMTLHGQPVGLIYADMAQAGGLVLGPADLMLLRALRDHAVAELLRQPAH